MWSTLANCHSGSWLRAPFNQIGGGFGADAGPIRRGSVRQRLVAGQEVKADTSHRVKYTHVGKRFFQGARDGGLHHRVAIGQPLLKNTSGRNLRLMMA